MGGDMKVETIVGEEVLEYIHAFVHMSDVCLSGWPFFIKKEAGKAEKMIESLRSVASDLHAVVVKDGDTIIGGTYGHPIFPYGPVANNIATLHDLSRVYWIAQTTILPEYQGKGISHMIYNARDPWVIASGKYDAIAHVLVIRGDRPASHVPYDVMWGKRGYRHLEGMDLKFKYADALDNPKKPTEKTTQIWLKELRK